jgi:enoyl-CoA hydratase
MSEKLFLTNQYKNILVSEIDNEKGLKVCLVQINRPNVMNALNIELMGEIADVLFAIDKNDNFGCSIITGNEKAFAAGADIKEMAGANVVDIYYREMFESWDRIRDYKKPVIAAVSGFALGGGCELSMLCDMIVAAKCAKFGQPEVNLGVIPGAGGTQRLTRAIGKARAMEIILTGRMVDAGEMYEAGLITKLSDDDKYLEDAIVLAKLICTKSPIAIQLAKDSILRAFDTTIETGMDIEKKNFYMLFATEDKMEGMKAFIEKRKPIWKGK